MPHLKGKRPSRVGRSNSYLLSFYSYFFLSQGFCKYLYARHLLVTGLWKGAVPSPHCGEFMCTMGACHINNMQLQVCTNARESQQQEGWLTHCAHPGRFSKTHWAIFFYLLVYLFYIIERNVCIWSSLKLSPKHIILLIEGPCHYSRKHTRDWNRPHPSHLVKGIDPSIGLFLCFPINLSLSRSPFPGSPKHAVKWTILRRNSLLIPISIFISPLLFPDELSKELNLLSLHFVFYSLLNPLNQAFASTNETEIVKVMIYYFQRWEILSDPKVNSQSSPSPVVHSFLETLPALGCQDWSLWVFLLPWEDCPAQLSWWSPFPSISSSLWNASKGWSPPLFPLILLGISIQANGFKKHCPEMAVEIPDHLSLLFLLSLVGSSICISNTPYLKQNSWLSPLTFSSPRTFHLWKWQLHTSRYLVQKPWSHHWLFFAQTPLSTVSKPCCLLEK